MPPPVRRFVRVLTCLTVLALAAVATAAAGNGGLAPVSPASPDAKSIRDIYWLILAITGGIFVLVTGTLLIFIVRYRSKGRPRELEGPQVRGHTKLELAWTAGPVILLAIIAGFVFWKVSDIGANSSWVARAAREITVEGHQYYWNFTYPNGATSVDTLRLPVDRTVRLTVLSADVNHSWWIPALGGKLDAIPGQTNHLTLRATKLGTFAGQCAEFCGLLHAAMLAHVQVLPAGQYDSWVSARANAQLALGKETFVGVCAKCHGLAAQGGYGPNIAQNPLLGDRNGLTKLLRHGTGKMPAVGNDWSQAQLDATIAYLHQRFVKGASSGSQG